MASSGINPSLRRLMDPFGVHEDDIDSEETIPKLSVLWLTFMHISNGEVVGLTNSFFANVWPDFWPHVTKNGIQKLSTEISETLKKDADLKRQAIDEWMEKTAIVISKWLKWETEFFRVFPWKWVTLNHETMRKMQEKYGQWKAIDPIKWLKIPDWSREVGQEVRNLEMMFNEVVSLKQKHKRQELTDTLRDFNEENLTKGELYTVRTLKMRMKVIREDEIPKMKALSIANSLIEDLKKSAREREKNYTDVLKSSDYNLKFRLGCDDDKSNQWLAIIKYKGFVGELIFSEHFGDIYDSIPEEQRLCDGLPMFKKESKFMYVEEHLKPSIKEIILRTKEEYQCEVAFPSVVPYYFPDFHVVQESDDGVIFITIFECTWSRLNSKKTVNDITKWESFVKSFNKLNAKELVDGSYPSPFMILNVSSVNVSTFVRRKMTDTSISLRIDAVNKLIQLYNEGVLSHDNPNILQTIDFSQTLRFPKDMPRDYTIDKTVLEILTSKVNDEVKADYGVDNYVEKLEEHMNDNEVNKFEDDLLEKIDKTFTEKFVQSQRKWVTTTSEELHKGVDHIKSMLFNKERILRLVSNNHHDENQFTMLEEHEDLSDKVQRFFDVISDILETMNDSILSKLKPTLCMMVHASAGHTTYLTNNYQFGFCSGLDHKTSKISRVIRHLKEKFPDDVRTEVLVEYNKKGNKNKKGHAIWKNGEYSLCDYENSIDSVLSRLADKKVKNDFTYRYTDSTNCSAVFEDSYPEIENICCPDMVMRFEHSANEIHISCPSCNKRYKVIDPFAQLHNELNKLDEDKTFTRRSLINFLVNVLRNLDHDLNMNKFLTAHILQFLISITDSGVKIVDYLDRYLKCCHPYHKSEILKMISRRKLLEHDKSIIKRSGHVLFFRELNTPFLRQKANQTAESWYTKNLKYLRDPKSKELLTREFEALINDNPYTVCLADLAQKLILVRSQHFTLSKAIGYVTFSSAFGPIFTSGSDPNSESIKSFGLGGGHFFINHRTLRMIQGLPLMLISNKLLVDKMANRKCNPGDYTRDDLIQFCLLNSRRLNVNLQNIRYFFMACWSNIHSPFLFKKLEMDFVKTSEFKICCKLIKYMEEVLKNYDFLDARVSNTKLPDELSEAFPVLFNEKINANLKDTDLCLHSFYLVHLFEKTIAGKVQEIRKVFEKFITPKMRWMEDLKNWNDETADDEMKTRILRSDGLCDDFDKVFQLTLKDMLNHTNKYPGFSLQFIKCAARKFNGFSKNEFSTEIRQPRALTELLKATSTLKKFDSSADFNKICKAIDTKSKIQHAMKKTEKNVLELLKKLDEDPTVSHIFPKCCKVLNDIKRKDANDITEEDMTKISSKLSAITIHNLNYVAINEIDELLSKTQFVQICENFCEQRHRMRNRKDELEGLFEKFCTDFPNAFALHEKNPVLSFLLFCDQLKWDLDLVVKAVDEVENSQGDIISNDMSYALLLSVVKSFHKNSNYCKQNLFSSLDKDRTPRNRNLKKKLSQCTSFMANPRSMTTALICDILSLMNEEVFSDTYTVCSHFKFNSDPIVFAMAFKEQFGGERELTIGDIWSKLTLKMVEDISRELGRCMKNTCLNEPSNETVFKDMVTKTQQSNKFFIDSEEIGECTPNQFWSIDRSKWGPFHQGLSFYTVIRILLRECNTAADDVVDIVKYSCLKHALKHFEIHHNVILSVFKKAMRKSVLYEEGARWYFDMTKDVRPDINLEPWEIFVINQVRNGKKSVHTRMDMGQGMLHSCSDVYGAVIDNYITQITARYFREYLGMDYKNSSMNTSDDAASVIQISGKGSFKHREELMKVEILIKDLCQRLANQFISEKSVGSPEVLEFKSSFMRNGEQVRVLVKFLSTQLTIGKDCLPEDFFNTYNSLTKSILTNGGSQMMCDLLYLAKLQQMSSVYTLSKTIFEDCVRDAPPSRFGMPNLTCADIYFHTSKFILASRAVNFLRLCGFSDGKLILADPTNQKAGSSQTKLTRLNTCDTRTLPLEMTTHNGTTYKTESLGDQWQTTVTLRGGKNPLIMYHKEQFNPGQLEMNLMKYFTLARTPGTKESETICCGISTLIPSQRGKSETLENTEHQSLRNMSYLNYFIMRNQPKILQSAKMRSAQALYQSISEDAKRTHQNMVFTKGRLINRGTFCFFGNRLVDQKTAFNCFNCEDDSYKCIINLIKTMNKEFEPVKRLINAPLKTDSDYVIELRDSSTTHKEKDIPLHTDSIGRIHYDIFMVRAYVRNQEFIKNGGALSEEDAYIIRNTNVVVDRINADAMVFKKLYSHFTDTELMLMTLGTEREVLSGVYMFEESADFKEQICLILQGCIHNHVQRIMIIPNISLPERPIDIVNIQRALLMTTIYTQETEDEDSLRRKITKLFAQNPVLDTAMIEGMEDIKYSYICSVIRLFIYPSDEMSHKKLLSKFKDIKNFEETGTIHTRVWTGTCYGTRFKCVKDMEDQMNVKLMVSPCDAETQKKVARKLKYTLDLINEKFEITVNKDMPKPDVYSDNEKQTVVIQYRKNKFVLCLAGEGRQANSNFFQTCQTEKERFVKWSNCTEFVCNNPFLRETSSLWDLIKNDEYLQQKIKETNFTSFTMRDYHDQFERLMTVVETTTTKSNSKLRSCLINEPYMTPVVRDAVSVNIGTFCNLCPESIVCNSSPFTILLLHAKLIVSAERQEDVFDIENFMKVLPDHTDRVSEMPAIKYHGHPLTGIATFDKNNFKGLKLMGFNFENNMKVVKERELKNQYGNMEERYLMVFNREVSISNLFRIRDKETGKDSRILILDVDKGEVVHWDLTNAYLAGVYDKDVAENPGWRIGYSTTKFHSDLGSLRPGMSEEEIAAEYEHLMKNRRKKVVKLEM